MTERLAFISACLNRAEPITVICDQFGISEKTGYKWLQRFKADAGSPAALLDRSHAPHTRAHRMTSEVATRLLALRRRYPKYGPVKLRDWLVQHEPEQPWPAPSSIGVLLARAGLVRRKRRHPRTDPTAFVSGRTAATDPNTVWTADFKGEFRLGGHGGPYCYPLTVLDLHTHFLLGCTALRSTAVATARQTFVQLFRTYGLPDVLRTDNGVPFAQPNAIGRLGALAFWWVRLGIRPEHITPARPAENGAHERFHRTLGDATTHPAPAPSLRAQQGRFDRHRLEYNTERPHASLPAHAPPATLYTPSRRPYPARLPTIEYPLETAVRLVDRAGVIKWHNHAFFLTTNLTGQYVGLTARAPSELVTVAYASLALGDIDPRTHRFIPDVRWLGECTPHP
jgi:transposase InsO family protein